jgi:hypothetical protein
VRGRGSECRGRKRLGSGLFGEWKREREERRGRKERVSVRTEGEKGREEDLQQRIHAP